MFVISSKPLDDLCEVLPYRLDFLQVAVEMMLHVSISPVGNGNIEEISE